MMGRKAEVRAIIESVFSEAPMANAINDVKLLSCPFCGGEALSANRTGSAWFIHADHSKNCTLAEFHRTELDAISNWNRRAMSQLLDPIDITINPMGTAPSGEDAMEPSEIDVHEGAWAVVIGTNGKTAGWIDTHALFAHQIYRHHILTSPAPSQHTGWSDEAAVQRLKAAYIAETGSTMWPTDEQFRRILAASSIAPATGFEPQHIDIAHDGFSGDVIGSYVTREGKRGFVVQQEGTRVVHVYGEKFAGISPSVAKESGEP